MARAGYALLQLEPDIDIVGEATMATSANNGSRSLARRLVATSACLVQACRTGAPVEERTTLRESRLLTCMNSILRARRSSRSRRYVVKRAAESELIAAIRATSRGEFYWTTSWCNGDGTRCGGGRRDRPRNERAETQLLRLLAQGLSMNQVAQAMSIEINAAKKCERQLRPFSLRSRITSCVMREIMLLEQGE